MFITTATSSPCTPPQSGHLVVGLGFFFMV
jgi:hypothetical protein